MSTLDAAAPAPTEDITLKARIETLEAQVLREALDRHRWNKSQAAVELGLSRVGLSAKIQRYGLVKSM
jgi:two-component system, NtrC family, response regulator HupR/HoxA